MQRHTARENTPVSDLIDTTEMYLRTIYELVEDGVTPLRARIAERLEQSGPTVSQTVARMERDGLLTVENDRHLQLTTAGFDYAQQVMRRHRLAECLLLEVIKVPIDEVHAEACRWEHVMTDAVEARISALLGNPTLSPFGNVIAHLTSNEESETVAAISHQLPVGEIHMGMLIRVSEVLQEDSVLIATLFAHNIRPQHEISIAKTGSNILLNGEVEITTVQAEALWLRK
jgi:DtxR family Mn-dependent transcriptional regulator